MLSRGPTSLRLRAALLLPLGAFACFSDSGDLSAGSLVTTGSSGEGSSTSTGEPTTSEPSTSSASSSSSSSSSTTGITDQDSDSIPDAQDNCPAAPNSHQLDFDGDSVGNACDEPLRYAIVDGAPPAYNQLETSGSVNAGMGILCEFPVQLVVVAADVQITLDDVGAAELSVSSVQFADTPGYTCTLGTVTFKAALEGLTLVGDAPPVGFPFTLGDHDAGQISGTTGAKYTAPLEGVINILESNAPMIVPLGPSPLTDATFTFPKGQVTASAKSLSFKIDDASTIIFEQGQLVPVRLTGLAGALNLTM